MMPLLWLVLMLQAVEGGHGQERQTRPPVALFPDLGSLHHPIATQNAEAQKFFDQGLTLVYGFNHEEAVRLFQRAAELDARSPMPHWGIALALGPNINLDVDPDREKAAYDEAQKASSLAGGGSAREQAYVAALVTRYSNDPKADLKALAVRYRDAMRDLSRQYPDDLDAATLYAESLMDLHPWQLWSSDGSPTEGTEEIVAVLESVLRRDPSHIGANHYYIHAVEASRSPERALTSAARLDSLVPDAGHLVHMPAHIYMRTGDYKSAVDSNARAADVDRRYVAATKAEGVYPMMYFGHNVDFLSSAAMMTGQFHEASRAADELVAMVSPAIATMQMLEPFGAKKLYVLLRFARWNDVLALPKPDAQLRLLNALYHFGRSVAHAELGQVADAERERSAYQEARRSIKPDDAWGFNTAGDMLAVCDGVLDARIAWAKKDARRAIESWTRAVSAEDTLKYNEPADWFYPVRESLGAAQERSGMHAEAELTFREDLRRNPRNGRSLFGLRQALAAQHKTDAAALVDAEFKTAWKDADVELRLEDF